MKQTLVALAVTAAILAGCSTKPDVPPIAEWDVYSDQFFRVNFTQPKGWQVQTEPSRVTITSSVEAMEKFFDPYAKKPAGAQLIVSGEKQDSVTTLDAVVEAYKTGLTESGFQITATNEITIDSLRAVEVVYGGRFDENTALRAVRAYVYKDTVVYYVHFGGFNEYYEPYRSVYDSAVKTLVLPKPKVAAKAVDPSLPVEDLAKFENERVVVQYPENFAPSIGKPSGDVEYTMAIKGLRDDIKVTLDVRPAKGVGVDKIVEQNTKNLSKVSSPKDATVSGIAGKMVTYVPTRGVDARMYFVVKDDKFHRIIVFWPTALQKETLPALEKVIASLKLK
jgi:hypothetical protein